MNNVILRRINPGVKRGEKIDINAITVYQKGYKS